MAFISGKKNREIGAAEPALYLPMVLAERGKSALRLQAIPLDANLYSVSKFRAFLEARRNGLAEVVNAFLGKMKGE